jgi:hypothetical protein
MQRNSYCSLKAPSFFQGAAILTHLPQPEVI